MYHLLLGAPLYVHDIDEDKRAAEQRFALIMLFNVAKKRVLQKRRKMLMNELKTTEPPKRYQSLISADRNEQLMHQVKEILINEYDQEKYSSQYCDFMKLKSNCERLSNRLSPPSTQYNR